MPIVGTAGHVDHGKSTLVQALTGRDPDRWEEEKRRGLTIDLGFAWTKLPGDQEVGFVDVPGHERFIKNMLAGIEAIDVALLVVAADEGWMPQSEEHLAVLDLLGVTRGVVALTRTDLVDEETMELAQLEVEDRLAGTTLADSPIVPVAAPRGAGLDELAAALAAAVEGTVVGDSGRPRMWVDRAFVVSGAGTVVTGTLLNGWVARDDRLALWPGAIEVRVRGLQSHEADRVRLGPGNRAALNLGGLEHRAVQRGSMLGLPGQWVPSRRFLVALQTVRHLEEPLQDRGAYHLHLGTGAWRMRLRTLPGGLAPPLAAALVATDAALPVTAGDRFIVRDVGRRAVVAGGRILDPAPPARLPPDAVADLAAAVMEDGRADAIADALIRVRRRERLEVLRAHSGGGTGSTTVVAELAISDTEIARLREQAVKAVADFHAANRLRPGIPKATLASRLGLDKEVVEALVAADRRLRDNGTVVSSIEFTDELPPEAGRRWEQSRRELEQAGLAVPRLGELGLEAELVHALIRSGRLIRVSDEYAYLPEQLEQVKAELPALPAPFSVADFRDRLGVTRRYAVPLLEWLDAQAITVREGDGRRLRPT